MPINIISHRGYWITPAERNQFIAFNRAVNHGLGIETDIRDYDGKLVISHDVPSGKELPLEDLIKVMDGKSVPLALNIKSDGLAEKLNLAMEKSALSNWFVFDMSIPDMRCYLDLKMPVFARMSEVEKEPAWIEEISGIWLDCFHSTWYEPHLVSDLLARGLSVCVVSPELHAREYQANWKSLQDISENSNLMLCTDYPLQAHGYFG